MNAFYVSYPKLSRPDLAQFLFGSSEDLKVKARHYFLACSGGLDSMVLMDLFAAWARETIPTIGVTVVHVNYGLRGEESEGDAAFVVEQAKLRGMVCKVLVVEPGSQPVTGIQEWARELRYQWFSSLCAPQDKVLLAHHEDDHIETILMRVVRGSGLSGFEGMKSEDGKYWRPFLKMSRRSIEEFAQREKILHREDGSNAKLDYSRNRIRKLILPELEGMFPGAGQNLKALAQAGQEWSRFFGEQFANLTMPTSPDAWRKLGFYPASEWLLTRIRSENERWVKVVGRSWLETVYRGLVEGLDTVVQLDPKYQVRLKHGRIEFERITTYSPARWQQYAKELTRSGLSALLSEDSRLEVQHDADGDEQVKKDIE